MESMIGVLVTAGMTLIGFVAVFVKVGARFAVLENDVTNLKNENKEKSEKLDSIQRTVSDIRSQLAVLIDRTERTYNNGEKNGK